MTLPRISASSYSNTAPLIWSFLCGSLRERAAILTDNAPARSAELLAQNRVDAALVPVIEYRRIPNARLVPDVCVGARERVRSVCLVTKGEDLANAKTVALDISSRTSVALSHQILAAADFLVDRYSFGDIIHKTPAKFYQYQKAINRINSAVRLLPARILRETSGIFRDRISLFR